MVSGAPRKRRRRRLLLTTNTDDNAIAAPATSGFSMPSIASGMAATLYANAQKRLRLDGRERAPREADRVDDGDQVAAHEGQVARFDGDIRAGAHRDAEVCRRECDRIVDAIADHRHDPAMLLQGSHDLGLLRRQHLGAHFVDADLRGDRASRAFVVAREQDRREAQRLQLRDGRGTRDLHGVGDGEDAASPTVPRDRDDGAAAGLERRLLFGEGRRKRDAPLG